MTKGDTLRTVQKTRVQETDLSPGLVQAIRAVEAGEEPDDVILSTVGTSAKCALALIYDRPALLPPPYTTQAEAWRRLDTHQRGIVRRHVPHLASHLDSRLKE